MSPVFQYPSFPTVFSASSFFFLFFFHPDTIDSCAKVVLSDVCFASGPLSVILFFSSSFFELQCFLSIKNEFKAAEGKSCFSGTVLNLSIRAANKWAVCLIAPVEIDYESERWPYCHTHSVWLLLCTLLLLPEAVPICFL